MADSLSIGWSEAQAAAPLRAFKALFGFNLIVQSLVGLSVLILPGLGRALTGVEAAEYRTLLVVWGAMVLVASALQAPSYFDPIRYRFTIFIAIGARYFMGLVFLFLGYEFWRMAAFDLIFAVLLSVLFHRVLIAELQTRP